MTELLVSMGMLFALCLVAAWRIWRLEEELESYKVRQELTQHMPDIWYDMTAPKTTDKYLN